MPAAESFTLHAVSAYPTAPCLPLNSRILGLPQTSPIQSESTISEHRYPVSDTEAISASVDCLVTDFARIFDFVSPSVLSGIAP